MLNRVKRESFAVDIDSTLYNFEQAARDAFLKLYLESEDREYLKGVYTAWVEWRSPADVCGLDTWLKVVSMCHTPEVILAQEPFSGVVATLTALTDSDHEVMYISHRTGDAADATRQWLMACGFPAGDIICTDAEKSTHMRHCRYLIDDRPKTLIEFVYDSEWATDMFGKRKAIGLTYPYNQALTDIPNIYLTPTWAGINSYLVAKGLIDKPAYQPLEV